MTPPRPIVLVIRDGWGRNPNPGHEAFNAIHLASTPVSDRLEAAYPSTLIRTSGEDVGLTDGTMGNSEVGHQNIGAGRIVDQDAMRITRACREGKLVENAALTGAIRGALADGRPVHLMGICSDAGVHGQLEHLFALLRLCADLGAPRDAVLLHMFTDGRDTGPFSGIGFLGRVEEACREIGVGRIVSVVGRFYAMDRDNRWDRVERAWHLLTARRGEGHFATAAEAVRHAYDHPAAPTRQGDEFVPPMTCGEGGDDPARTGIRDGDAVIFYNYRGDRPRELCSAFLLPEFHGAAEVTPSPDTGERGFDRGPRPDVRFVLMTPYSERLAALAPVAFPKPPKLRNILGEVLSAAGLTQFRCAETEKYPHVTFFFNDYRDEPFEGERREIIQSPTDVKTYDERPEMSALGVASAVLRRLEADDCEDVIIVNFANGDMVGHTGNLAAAIAACETVDACVGRIVERTLARGGELIVFADHGNAEQMFDPETGSPHTAHTTYEVPLVLVSARHRGATLRAGGRLADVAPTALALLGLAQPPEMSGVSLVGSPSGGTASS